MAKSHHGAGSRMTGRRFAQDWNAVCPWPAIPTSSRATILRPTRSRNARGRCDPFPLLRWGRGPDRGNEGKRRTPHRPLPPFCPAGEREICPKPKRSEEHTSELQSLMRISYAVFCLKKKTHKRNIRIKLPDT